MQGCPCAAIRITLSDRRESVSTLVYQDGLTKKHFGFRYYPVFKASCPSPLGGALADPPTPETKNPPLGGGPDSALLVWRNYLNGLSVVVDEVSTIAGRSLALSGAVSNPPAHFSSPLFFKLTNRESCPLPLGGSFPAKPSSLNLLRGIESPPAGGPLDSQMSTSRDYTAEDGTVKAPAAKSLKSALNGCLQLMIRA